MFTSNNLLRLITENIIIIFVFLIISFFSILFFEKKIESISTSIILNNKLELELKKRTENFSILEKDTNRVKGNDILVNNAFLSSDDISDFINALDSLNTTKTTINQNYHFDTPAPSSVSSIFPISTISYSNSIVLDIQNFSDYLKNYEKLPYFSKIDSINISSQDKMGWNGPSLISISATLFTKSVQ